MAGNTRYHRVSEEPRVSMQSTTGNADIDASLLLLEPTDNDSDDGDAPPKNEHKFKCHPTVFLRLIAVCVLISSFVLFIVSRRPRSVAATIFVCFALVRNILVIFHHIIKRHIRIRIEFRNRSLRSGSPRKSCPEWLESGPLHLLLDSVLVIVLLITTIIATQGSYGWRYRYDHRTQLVVPACILAYIGNCFYLLSIPDMGKPSNITITGGILFSYGKDKQEDRPEHPQSARQVYRDYEAAGGLGVGATTAKTGADSPVII